MLLLQLWECVVESVSLRHRCDDFAAVQMHDLTADNPEEFAEIYLSAFEPDDLPRLHEGTVFYWAIGKKGEVDVSEFWFQAPAVLSPEKKAEIERRASELAKALGVRQ